MARGPRGPYAGGGGGEGGPFGFDVDKDLPPHGPPGRAHWVPIDDPDDDAGREDENERAQVPTGA
jgi:hypothetical protein